MAYPYIRQEVAVTRRASAIRVSSSVVFRFVSICLLLTACGGGSGGDGGGVPAPVPLKTSVVRTLVPGDSWRFSVSGTLTDDTGQAGFTGTASAEILPSPVVSPITSDSCHDQYTAMILNFPGAPLIDSHVYFRQDANGSILEYGEGVSGVGDIWVDNTASGYHGYFVNLPSPMVAGYSSGMDNITYDDGTTATYSIQVAGTDNVSTGMGTYESYEIHYNYDYTDPTGAGGSTMSTMWYVPGLGMIKEDAYVASWDGPGMVGYTELHYTATLTGTSVSY
jgi:hypothetical protein